MKKLSFTPVFHKEAIGGYIRPRNTMGKSNINEERIEKEAERIRAEGFPVIDFNLNTLETLEVTKNKVS